jgi:hypothetical protein
VYSQSSPWSSATSRTRLHRRSRTGRSWRVRPHPPHRRHDGEYGNGRINRENRRPQGDAIDLGRSQDAGRASRLLALLARSPARWECGKGHKPREPRSAPATRFNALVGFCGRLRPRAMRQAAVASSVVSRSALTRLRQDRAGAQTERAQGPLRLEPVIQTCIVIAGRTVTVQRKRPEFAV